MVDNKWVFTIKPDELGNPARYKARVVARGFTQQYLIDYNETFAPVARIASFRLLLAFANQFNLLVHHMDVKTAFLNGKLKEEIYMKVPEGVKCNPNVVCKLNKSLYGLKQSARCWFETFEKVLSEVGFKNSAVDRCVYILDKGNVFNNIYAILYVDDLVIVTRNNNVMSEFKNYLANKFSMSDLREIKLFLGIRILRDETSMSLDQQAYINVILRQFNMYECTPYESPLIENLEFDKLELNEYYDAPCQNLLGCLMYLMICTRPDLSFPVNVLSRFVGKNNKTVWEYLKSVLRYLKGTSDLKLVYRRNFNEQFETLTGYVDSDWAGDKIDRKSTTGFLFKLYDKCVICWNTRKQRSVADSSTAAEYMALYEAVKEALWLKSLMGTLKIELRNGLLNINEKKGILIYEDNNGCIAIASNPGSHKLAKHIDIKYHYSREQVAEGNIRLRHVESKEQMADMLTKSVGRVKLLKLRLKMNLE